MRTFLKFHWPAFVLAVVIGIIIVAPPWVWHFSSGYRGVDMMKTNTETLYVAFVQEVYDGHPLLGNPYLADLKDNLYLFPPLSANLVAFFGKLLFFTPIEAVMVSRFFIIAGLTLLIYFFGFTLTKRRLVGLVAAPFVLMGYTLVDPHLAFNLVHAGAWSPEKTFIDYGRPLTPQISVLFLYGYLLCLWKFLHDGRKSYGIASAVLLGLSFYTYLFTWSFLLSLNFFLVLVYVALREWGKVKKIVIVSIGAILIGIPYLWHVYRVSQHPWYAEAATRFGFLQLREPAFSRLVLGAGVLGTLGWRLLGQPVRRFFLAFFLTAIFVVNEQVLTGRFIFNHHFHWYYNTPLVIIFLVVLLFACLQRFRSPWIPRGAAACLIAVFLFNGVMTQVASYRHALPMVQEEQRYASLINWLNRATERDSVVLASDANDLIPALTHNNVYHGGAALYTLIPDERILHSYLVYSYLAGVPREEIRAYLEAHRADISNTAFGYRYYFQKNVCVGCFPTSTIDTMVVEYQSLTDENFLAYVRRYPLRYVVWDAKKHPEWNVDRRWKWREIQRLGDIVVYDLWPISSL